MDNSLSYNSEIKKGLINLLMFTLYSDEKTIYREYVQNALDSINKAIDERVLAQAKDGVVNIDIDARKKVIVIKDNGTGINANDAVRTLLDISASTKDGVNQAGQFGIGRLVGGGYCHELIFRITDPELGHGTRSEKYAANVAAIRTLKQIESEECLATPEEQEILSRYVGWGGLADCFDERHGKYLELKSLLDEDEYAAARASSLTAFYTSPVIIGAMYQALSQMGFRQGNILEPSCGVGNFIGMLPDSMADSKAYGVEIDSISGRIAQQLYQNSSIAVNGFEKVQMPDSFFDVAIGNVPFGDFKVRDKKYDKNHWLIHDYFFGKTLDKVRPGGVIAFITSKGTMDKENSAVRKYLAQRADLIGAIRLPNNAFKANAGTEVTSDIIFLQKRDRMTDIEPDWVHLELLEL